MKKYLYLILSLLLVFGLSAAAFSYNEAPELEELVAAGELPSLAERLPEKPLVVEPGVLISEEDLDWEVGQYGGTLRFAHVSPGFSPNVFTFLREPLIIAQGVSVEGMRGNIVEQYEVNDDHTVFTFYLRKGLKWSDGYPVTTEDVRFAYEDVMLNEKITPLFPVKYKTGNSPYGEPMKLEIINDYTFKISFDEPYGGFLRHLIIENWSVYSDLIKPKHYLEQFHINYTSIEDLKPLFEEEELEDEWWELFDLKDFGQWELTDPDAADFPVLSPWYTSSESTDELLIFERNPYYFKVDNQGHQLPYIDKLVSTYVSNIEMVNMKILTGEVGHSHGRTALDKLPLYKENEEKGGYNIVLLDEHFNPITLYINMTYDDPVWREIVRDIRFRKALSIGMDREEIIETLFYGFAKNPETFVPSEFDLNEANRLLDEVGLEERDEQGYRLRPDGAVFEIFIETADHKTGFIPAAEMLASQFDDNLDIKVSVKKISRELWGQRSTANQLKATIFWAHAVYSTDNDITSNLFSFAAPLWMEWYNSQGNTGEEPPSWAKEAFEIDEARWRSVTGSEKYFSLFDQGIEWHNQYIPVIPLAEDVKIPIIESADLGNVPHSGVDISNAFSGEQFFFKQ